MYRRYYEILGLPEGAGDDKIRQAYRQLALKWHPDVNPSPDAHQRFIEICEAYEVLSRYAKQERPTIAYAKAPTPEERSHLSTWEEVVRNAREQAKRQADMRFEKLRKEHEAFQKSGLYDVTLVLRYTIHLLSIFISIGLILFPAYIAVTQNPWAILYLAYFWIVGLFLCLYIYSNRESWFRLGEIYFKPSIFLETFEPKPVQNNELCFYCKGEKADGPPFEQTLLKVKDITLQHKGPMLHGVKYNRQYTTVVVPRSSKAYTVHFFTSVIKLITILVFIFFVPAGGFIWKLIFGMFIAGIISSLLLLVTHTRSKNLYLLNSATLVKIVIWIVVLGALSHRTSHFQIYGGDYIILGFFMLIFFIDIIDSLASLVPGNKMYIPFFRQDPRVMDLFRKGYKNVLEIPVWSTLYPLFRWMF